MSVSEFGLFSVGVAVVTALLMACRGFLGTSLAVLSGEDNTVNRELRVAAGAGLLAGALLGALVALCGLILSNPVWLVLGIGLPFLIWQDVLRYGAISLERPAVALSSDSVRLAFSTIAFAYSLGFPQTSETLLATAWPVGAGVAAIIISATLGTRPTVDSLLSSLKERLSERMSYGFDTLMMSITSILYVIILTLQLGSEGVAGLRGAGTALGPLNTLVAGLSLVMVPRLVRAKGTISDNLRTMAPLSLGLVLIATFCGSAGLWLPVEIGELILGATWVSAAVVLPIMGLEYAVSSVRTSISTVLKAQRAAGKLAAARVMSTVGMLCVATFAPLFGGPVTVAWAMVINSLISVSTITILLLLHSTRANR